MTFIFGTAYEKIVMSFRYGDKKVKQQVDAIGRKNVLSMARIAMGKLCKWYERSMWSDVWFIFKRFFVEKLAETDILANLRSEFCISKGPGLYEHQRYCDLYLQCNEQGVGVTMECSRTYFYCVDLEMKN